MCNEMRMNCIALEIGCYFLKYSIKKYHLFWASEMAEWREKLATKPDYLSLNLGTQKVEEKK